MRVRVGGAYGGLDEENRAFEIIEQVFAERGYQLAKDVNASIVNGKAFKAAQTGGPSGGIWIERYIVRALPPGKSSPLPMLPSSPQPSPCSNKHSTKDLSLESQASQQQHTEKILTAVSDLKGR